MNHYLNVFVNVSILLFLYQIISVEGHGRLLEPSSRASRWRFNYSAPADYNDNQGFCGGFFKQWEQQQGKCGLCGDYYGDTIPRSHEYGGLYGEGVVVKQYRTGSQIDIGVFITANHKGYFSFDLCNMDKNQESEECFQKYPLELTTGGYKYQLTKFTPGWFNTSVKIPDNLECQHCVFRWTYTTGNNWGLCADNTGSLGCGPQENFKACSDISIF